jgi:hypothetical protein
MNKPSKIWAEGMKVCSKCKQMKPLADFWKGVKSNHGVRPACIECMKKDRKENSRDLSIYHSWLWQKGGKNNREKHNLYMRNRYVRVRRDLFLKYKDAYDKLNELENTTEV